MLFSYIPLNKSAQHFLCNDTDFDIGGDNAFAGTTGQLRR